MTNQEHIQALIDNITTDLHKLRSLIEEPVGIQFAGEVRVEVRPASDDGRVSVYKPELGSVVIEFEENSVRVSCVDADGNIVEPIMEA